MAVKFIYNTIVNKYAMLFCIAGVFVLSVFTAKAQNPFLFSIKNGKMHITISKKITQKELENYSYKFKVQSLALQQLVEKNFTDSIKAQGWNVDANNDSLILLSKAFMPADVLAPVSSKNFVSPLMVNNLIFNYGFFVNKLNPKVPYRENIKTFTFVLPGFSKAKKVLIAGSFTNWQNNALHMQWIEKNWQITIPLAAGKHLYKFIVDDNWIVDPNNNLLENDNEGNTNSVICKSNYIFKLANFKDAKRVIVTGSFNNWNEKQLYLQKTDSAWLLPIFFNEGTYTYRFIVDGNWITDPSNNYKLKNEFSNEYNSAIALGKPTVFELKGFENAKNVTFLGNFNNYRDYEIEMKKRSSVWQVSYTLGDGNYVYCFKVDDKLVNHNGEVIKNPTQGTTLLVNPNHVFKLKGFETAKTVYVAGSFNNWNPKANKMKWENNQWVIELYLPLGKNTYKFIIDDKWIIDPANKLYENNEFDTGNSVIWK
jgi:Glycogen recognition site of AMP-activated protein kinase